MLNIKFADHVLHGDRRPPGMNNWVHTPYRV